MTPRPFRLMVDSASEDEPDDRYFGTLNRAVEEMNELPEHWRRFAWIIEIPHEGKQAQVHYKDGKKKDE